MQGWLRAWRQRLSHCPARRTWAYPASAWTPWVPGMAPLPSWPRRSPAGLPQVGAPGTISPAVGHGGSRVSLWPLRLLLTATACGWAAWPGDAPEARSAMQLTGMHAGERRYLPELPQIALPALPALPWLQQEAACHSPSQPSAASLDLALALSGARSRHHHLPRLRLAPGGGAGGAVSAPPVLLRSPGAQPGG